MHVPIKLTSLLILVLAVQFQVLTAQMQNAKNVPFEWKTDTTKHSVTLSEIMIVLPKGSFPTIDQPKFLSKEQGLDMFYPREPVIAVEIDGKAKGYSLNILTMHEISNDMLSGVPILVTYCPLCNSGIVYDRRLTLNGIKEIFDFEPSGMLRNSDMVMLDRQTETLWQQLSGTGIVGELDRKELDIIPSLILTVEQFYSSYPDGLLLSKDTGFDKAESRYGQNPYENYDSMDSSPYDRFFDSGKIDPRLPAMERVVDIENLGEYKIYSFSSAAEKKVINDEFNSKKVVIFFQEGAVSILDKTQISESRDVGTVAVYNRTLDGDTLDFEFKKGNFTDQQTGSTWDISGRCISGALEGKKLTIEPHGNHFAFAWLAFHPESEIFGQ